MTAAAYLDSSAIVKLVAEEPETEAMQRFIRRRRLVSSALARTEVLRAVLHAGADGITRASDVLSRFDFIRVSDRILSSAGTLPPTELRSLDAIHLATALQLGSDVRQLVTYDARMAEAATTLGLRVASP